MNRTPLSQTALIFSLTLLLTVQSLFAQVPTISSVTPLSGPVGTSITITGNNFNTIPGNNIIYFGAVKAIVTTATSTFINVVVPAGATYQPITVTTNSLTAYSPRPFTVTSGGNSNLVNTSFTTAKNFSTGNGPGNSITSDIDGDGKADVITADTYAHCLSILRNTTNSSTIAFAPKINYAVNVTGYVDLKMAVGDLNGDGKLDIALTNPSANKLLLYKNISTIGNIDFAAPIEFEANSDPTGIAITDFDFDGRPDIAIVNKIALSVYKNISTNGVISLAQRTDFVEDNNHDQAGLTIGDLDSDGKPDIVIAEKAYSVIPVYRNTSTAGNISFADRINYAAYGFASQLIIADFNQDGKPDIATATTVEINIYRNTSNNGTMLSYETTIATTGTPVRMAAGNINGDSLPDLIVAPANSNFFSVYQNKTSNSLFTFAPRIMYPAPFSANSIAVCDLDNDGKADIAATGKEAAAVTVIRNRQNEPYISKFTPSGGLSGTILNISGLNFTGTTSVKIGDSAVSAFTILSDTSIIAVVSNGATGNVTLINAFGAGSLSGFVFGPPPTITSFTPQAAPAGAAVTITGSFLTGVTAVSFGGVPAQSFSNTSDTSIVAYVGPGSSGTIRITVATGKDSIAGFTFLPPPSISSFSPDSALTGTVITVKGQNFTGTTAVIFGGVPATSFTVLADTSLQAVLGDGATGSISITTGYGTGVKTGFVYLGPSITSFTPTSGGAGLRVSINGTKFTGATVVSFGGAPADSFKVVSPTLITAYVGIAISGKVSVTTPAGTGYKYGFTGPPLISSFLPTSGPAGTLVTISGNNFGNTAQSNTVYFGPVKAIVNTVTDSTVSVTVPVGATYSPISVLANNLIGYSPKPYISTFTGGPLQSSSYALPQIVPNGFYTYANFVTGDLNNDGKPEIVGFTPQSDLTIRRNNSSGGHLDFDSIYYFYSNYYGIATTVADVTNDGLPDIITTSDYYKIISVYKNTSINGTISISPRKDYFLGSNPKFVTTADIDGDGKTDIAVINNNSQTVSIFRNAQSLPVDTVLFAVRKDFTTGSNTDMIVFADFDKDGKQDMAVVNSDSTRMSVFKNTSTSGNISFGPRINFTTGNNPRTITTGDLDGDGDIDIAVSNFTSYSISIFTNNSSNGNISFAPKIDLSTRNLPSYISINDLNGDGKPDIVVSQDDNRNIASSSIGIFSNIGYPGTMAFDTIVSYPVNAEPSIHITGDLDGDGKTDILYFADRMYYLRNKFNEAPVITSFTPATAGAGDTVIITGRAFSGATAIKFGNSSSNSFTVLSDTSISVVIYNGVSGNISVTTPSGTGILAGFTFISPPSISSFSPITGPIGTIVTIRGTYFNPTPASNIVRFGAVSVPVIAASTDSLQIVVPVGVTSEPISVTTNGRSGYSTQIFRLTFDGARSTLSKNSFDTPDTIPILPRAKCGGLVVGDLNADGRNDLLFYGTAGTQYCFSSLQNNSSPGYISFGLRSNHPFNYVPQSIALADINGDGLQDMVMDPSSDYYGAAVHKNRSVANGVISFAPDTIVNYVSGISSRLSAADIDRDGRPDLLLLGYYGSTVSIFRNTGVNDMQSFANPVLVAQVASSNFSSSTLVQDFDGDGKLDVGLVVNNKISIFKKTGADGNLTFSPVINIAINGYAAESFTTDIDGDGKPDIIERNYALNTICVHRNTSTVGNISFAAQVSLSVGTAMYLLAVTDIDGDGKPDMITNPNINITDSKNLTILKNNCTLGNISFLAGVNYKCSSYGSISIADLDGDGKPDIVSGNPEDSFFTVLRNRVGEPNQTTLCPPMASINITSDVLGPSYQWQVDTGTGFSNIYDNTNYGTASSDILRLYNIPSAWTGYQYRCVAGTNISSVFSLKFTNTWRGAISNAWENAANWSCGTVPDANTDVTINSGNVTISTNTTIRSLKLKPGVNISVVNGATLTVLH